VARRPLAEARRVDEVKAIRDKAMAMQVYATQAKDTALLDHATDIRQRAEIRAGELLAKMAERKERTQQGQGQGKGRTPQPLPKLADLGVSKSQSSRWQKMAALSPDEREAKIEMPLTELPSLNGRKCAPATRPASKRSSLWRGHFGR
jgi:hypothetical protein